MSIKKLSVDTIIYGIGPQLPRVISLLMLPILTPHLTPKDYGIYGTVIAYNYAVTSLKDLGMTSILSVSFFKYPSRYMFIWKKLFTFVTLWSIPLSFLLAIVIYFALPLEEHSNYWIITALCCVPVVLFDPTRWVGRKFFQLNQKPLPIVSINIIASFAGIISNLITIYYLKMGYMGWFIGSFVISIFYFFPYLWFCLTKISIEFDFNFNFKWIKRYLLIGLPVLPHYYATYLLNTSDRVVLEIYNISLDDIGIYSLAYIIGGYFAIIGSAMADASGPYYMKFFKQENQDGEIKARNLTFLMQFFILVIAFLTSLWMYQAYSVLIKNDSLLVGYSMAVIIVMSYTYRPIFFGPVSKLQYLYHTKDLWKISFMAGILNIILNIIFVPIYGIWASVFSTFFSLMFMGFRGYSLKNFRENNVVNYYPVNWFILICLATVLVFVLKDINVFYKFIVSLLIILSSLFVYKNYYKKLIF